MERETYLRYAKSRINLSGREMSPAANSQDTEQEKPGKTSLDCATIALKVLKTSMRQQEKVVEKQWEERRSEGSERRAGWAGR